MQIGKEVGSPNKCEQLRGIGGTCEMMGEIEADLEVDSNLFTGVRMHVVPDDTFTRPDVIVITDIIDSPNVVLLRKEGTTMLLDERDVPYETI